MSKIRKEESRDEEIEITAAMINAGMNEYALFDHSDRREWVVVAVYRAMDQAKSTQVGNDTSSDLSLLNISQ